MKRRNPSFNRTVLKLINRPTAQSLIMEIGQNLGGMHLLKRFHQFEVQQHGIIDDDAGSAALIEIHILVHHRQRAFAPDVQPIAVKFPTEAVLIHRFVKAGPGLRCTLMARPMIRPVRPGPGSGERLSMAGIIAGSG